MMHVLLYEFVTGGGCLSLPTAPMPGGTLLREGAAMAAAVCRDFARLLPPPAQITVLADARLPTEYIPAGCHRIHVSSPAELQAALQTTADVALVIAPESDGALLDACQTVRNDTGLLLNGPDELLRLTSSKHQTATWLTSNNIPCPAGTLLCGGEQSLPANLRFPLVVKPDDGCGSQDVHLVEKSDKLAAVLAKRSAWRVEEFVPGRAASVAALCGGGRVQWLHPCWQDFEPESFVYAGNRLIEDELLERRALNLVRRIEPLLADAIGYMGVDLVLGEPSDGSRDHVMEINPRLTTSYVRLRQAYRANLVAAMLELATDGGCCPVNRSIDRRGLVGQPSPGQVAERDLSCPLPQAGEGDVTD